MSKFYKGLILIIMMFGHNYVINQAQSLQQQIESIHNVTTTQFNWNLYSLPSAMSIVFIVPLGILYDKYALKILIIGAFSLIIGQTLVAFFGPYGQPYFFQILVTGRIIQAVGAEVLYMIQGNLASSWMGKMAGIIFILPEIGEIGNVFFTPFLAQGNDIDLPLKIGLFAAAISFLSCLFLYVYLKKQSKIAKLLGIKQVNAELIREKQYAKTVDSLGSIQSEIQFKNQNGQSIVSKNTQKRQNDSSIFILKKQQQQKSDQDSNKNTNKAARLKHQIGNDYLEKQEQISIVKAGKTFWLTIALCAINECLYFPFFDNATEHIETRFSIHYNRTGLYLCIPFISAMIITAIHGQYILHHFSRPKLIFYCSIIPLIGHLMIFLIPNSEFQESIFIQILLILGLSCFGMGLGSYYSVSFPAIGYAVPQRIRGTAYAILCFFQTISMTIVPLLSGKIIDDSKIMHPSGQIKPTADGFKTSSLVFVILSFVGVLIALIILRTSKKDSFQYEQCQEDEQQTSEQQKLNGVDVDENPKEISMKQVIKT